MSSKPRRQDAELCLRGFACLLESAVVSKMDRDRDKGSGKRMLWFIALWLLGVTGTALLVLPFHLMVAAAMRH